MAVFPRWLQILVVCIVLRESLQRTREAAHCWRSPLLTCKSTCDLKKAGTYEVLRLRM